MRDWVEDWRKWSEGDWRERFGEGEWLDVIRSISERSDQIETDLRSFISKKERPDVGALPPDVKPEGRIEQPVRLPPDPHVIVPRVEKDEDEDARRDYGRKAKGTRRASKRRSPARRSRR